MSVLNESSLVSRIGQGICTGARGFVRYAPRVLLGALLVAGVAAAVFAVLVTTVPTGGLPLWLSAIGTVIATGSSVTVCGEVIPFGVLVCSWLGLTLALEAGIEASMDSKTARRPSNRPDSEVASHHLAASSPKNNNPGQELATNNEVRKWDTDQYLEDLYGSKKTKKRRWGKPRSKAPSTPARQAARPVQSPQIKEEFRYLNLDDLQ
jgi:hypothetical protein